nr:IclR family transcriptional regulator C-terminal domain-containing protein [uncultured Pseudogulbenkiania sp.]
MAILQAFSCNIPHLSVAELSLKTGIPRAAVGRCLYTLSKLGFVHNKHGRSFALTAKALDLGHLYLASGSLASTSAPVLQRMSQTINESVSLARLDVDDIVCIACVPSLRRIQFHLFTGSKLPAFCTSSGRILLSHMQPAAIEEYLARVKLEQLTSLTETCADMLRHELEVARRKGYVVIDQEMEVGLRSIAVPIYAPDGSVPAGLSVLTDAARVTVSEMEERFLPVLEEAARELALFLV